MPKITAQGKTFECESGRGIGSCGTCAIAIVGEVSEPNWKEKARLGLPPHSSDSNRRLACQVKVLGDIQITKYDGFWGQGLTVISEQ